MKKKEANLPPNQLNLQESLSEALFAFRTGNKNNAKKHLENFKKHEIFNTEISALLLQETIKYDQPDLIELILEKGGKKIIGKALSNVKSKAMIDKLADFNVDLNAPLDMDGNTILHLVSDAKMAESLWKRGARFQKNNQGLRPPDSCTYPDILKTFAQFKIPLNETEIAKKIAIGKEKWAIFGDIGQEPLLPGNIDGMLEKECPLFKDKTLQESRALVLIPEKVNNQLLTLNFLEELAFPIFNRKIMCSTEGTKSELKTLNTCKSRWILITREDVPKSDVGTLYAQDQLIEKLVKDLKIDYKLPKLIEASICILLDRAFDTKGQPRLFNIEGGETNKTKGLDKWRRCQETHKNPSGWDYKDKKLPIVFAFMKSAGTKQFFLEFLKVIPRQFETLGGKLEGGVLLTQDLQEPKQLG